MKALRRGAIAALVSSAPLGMVPTSAEAQGQPGITQQDVTRGVTVQTRRRPDYDPLGVRLGSFRLDAAAEAGGGYDSNPLGLPRSGKDSGFSSQLGTVGIASDWTQHALGASGTVASRQYWSRSTLDWVDYNLGGFGRYDFSPYTSVTGQYRHYREHLDAYSVDVQQSGISAPVPYDSDEVQVTGTTSFNRLGLLATGYYRTFDYQNVTVNGIQNRVSLQSFNTAIGALGASYSLAPGRSVYAVVRLQDIDYTHSVSNDRDSFTYEGLVGFQYDFDGVWQARAAVGWRHRSYRSNAIKPLEGIAAEGQLLWVPTQLTNVSLNIARTIEESIRLNAVSYTRTRGGIRVDHELLRNVILTGDISLDSREYQSPSQTATDLTFTAGARWLINRSLSLTGQYTYANRVQASGGILDYTRNLVEVRLRVAL
jgi:hypothetical protein